MSFIIHKKIKNFEHLKSFSMVKQLKSKIDTEDRFLWDRVDKNRHVTNLILQ